MQADYRVDSIYVDEETGEIFAKCYDNVYGEKFEKYLGNPEEHQSSINASIMLEDSNFGMTDELRNEIISTFGLEDLGHEMVFATDEYDDEIYAGNANGIVTEDELDAQYNVEESFNLREAFNKIDIATDNKFDLRNLYESVDLRDEDKEKLATLIYDQEDPSVIYDTLNNKFLESIGMNEKDETSSPVVHKKSDGSYLVASESGDGYTAFNKDDVCQGHISANNENEAKSKFNSNKFDESLNEEVGEKITSTIDGSELEINEENVIPNIHSFKATYTTGDSAGNTYIFVEADDAGVEYLKSLGFEAENMNGDEFIDLPTECFDGKYAGSYYITRNDFSEYRDLLNEDLGDKWPWTKVYPQLEKAAQDVYISYNWNPDTSLEDTAKMDAEAAKVVKALVDDHKGESDWEEAYRRLLDIAPELELKESVEDKTLNENTEMIFAGINHDDAKYVTLVKDTEDNIERLIPQFDYCATIPATNNLIFIENNDEYISIDDTGFTNLDQIKNEIKKAIEAEMEKYPDEDEYEIEFDVPPYYAYLEGVSSVDKGVEIALEEITNSYVDCDSSSNYMLLNGSNFDTVLNGSSDKFIYTNVEEFLGTNELDEGAKLTESSDITWRDVYKIFLDIIDANYVGGNEAEISRDVEMLYREHDGEPAWDEAWLRWLDHTLEPGDEGFEEADALYKSERKRIRGRKLEESTSSKKTFAQWFDETQCYGDDTEFYPFDNYVKNFPNAEVLRNVTALDIVNNAHKFHDIYDVDSDDRMKVFMFASEELNIDEDILYKAWLRETPIAGVNESFESGSWDTSRVTDLVSHYLTEFDSMSIEQLQKKIWVTMEEEGSKLPDVDTFKQYVADTAAHFYEEIDSLGEGYELSPRIDYNPNHLRDDEGKIMADKWYASKWPDDEVGIEQLQGITLDDALKNRKILDHCDTQVRDRVYAQLDKYIPLSVDSPMYKEKNESKSIKEKYTDASDVIGWTQNSPDEKFSSIGEYKGYTYGKLVSPKDVSGWYLIDGPDNIVIGNLSDNTYNSKQELIAALRTEIHRLSLDESKSIKESRPDKDIKTTTNKVTIKYGNSVKEVEICKPIKVTNKQLNGYKDNYSIVDVLEESKYIKEDVEKRPRLVDTGLTTDAHYNILKILWGQLSDGYWESDKEFMPYWTGAKPVKENGKVYIEVYPYTRDRYGNKEYSFAYHDYSDTRILKKYAECLHALFFQNVFDSTDEDNAIEVYHILNGDSKNESKSINEAADTMIYLFPELTDEDLEMLKAYGLQLLGINHGAYGDEENWAVRGQEAALRRYADKYLGYELHPDYLYNEDDFAGDIEPLKESITNSPLSTAGPIPYAVKLLYQMDRFVMDVYDNGGWLMNGVPDGEFEETTPDEAMQNYTEHMWLIEDDDNPGEINWDDFNDFIDTFSNVTESKDYDQEERNRIIDEADTFVREYAKYKD